MESVRLPEIQSQTLGNGMRVLAVRDRRLPLVTLVLMVKKGAEADEEGRAGQADLALEMLTLGTEKRTSQQIALDVDSLGAHLAFYSGWDASFVEIEGLSEDLPSLVEIISDLVLHPTFPEPEFEQLKKRRIASLIQDQDESEIVADDQFTELVFEGTPYGHPRRGTVDSLRRLALDDLERFHRRHFVADQCVLMILGDIDFEESFMRTEEFMGPMESGQASSERKAFQVPHRAQRRIRIIHRPDLTQSQIRMGHPGIERTSPDFHRFQVANYILGGGGFSSRLMERVRSQKGYTYGISSSFKARRSPGPFVISTFTPNENTGAVMLEILEVVEAFVREGARQEELEGAKNYYLGSYPFRFETPAKIAREILEAELYGLGLQSLSNYPLRISEVTLADISLTVKQRLFPQGFSVVIVGNGDLFKRQVEAMGDVEIIDFQRLVAHRSEG
ncbi:MAG: insulinase family protein [Deltaproteobacteria bacterium]|nr:insulinase family protein [Deltaproteobacteria bacterium]